MDRAASQKELQELMKKEDNKLCVDCNNPNPQWASLSHAVFICLQCAGAHRGYGVHISFVRSVSMDTWQEEQMRRMKLGGNAEFMAFMRSYSPAEQGGYKEGMPPYDMYHSWAAAQYRDKLSAELAGNTWTPSAPPVTNNSPAGIDSPGRPSSAQGLRKSRASGRQVGGSSLGRGSASPAMSGTSSPTTPMSGSVVMDQKSANEQYFSSLGSINASRPDHLPPSQGGKYQGFGNSPSPGPGSMHPSYGLSSATAPSLSEFQENPVQALSKGWSLFSAAVVGATRVVSETVIQPGLEKVADPNFQESVKGYVSEAGKRAAALGQTANQFTKSQLGVDIAQEVGGLYDTVRGGVGAGPSRGGYGYGAVPTEHDGSSSGLYQDHDDDFFEQYDDKRAVDTMPSATSTSQTPSHSSAVTSAPVKKDEEWEDW